MSMSSRSSKGNHFKNGNYGSNHYQKKGILGNLFNMIGSGSNSNRHNNQYPNLTMQNQQYSNQPVQNQQTLKSERTNLQEM